MLFIFGKPKYLWYKFEFKKKADHIRAGLKNIEKKS